MKNSGRSWTFINQSNPAETIVIHDAHSAECLQAILKQHDGWFLKVDEVRALKPEPPSAPAPVAVSQSHQTSSVAASAHQEAPVPPPLPAQAAILKPVEDRRFSGKDRRAQKRFSTEFRVVLITGAHSYRNTTEDVSMGGMKLKRPVPMAFISQKCTIFISHPALRENVQISCKVLADPKDPRRVQFTETDPQQLKRLEEWLAETSMHDTGVA